MLNNIIYLIISACLIIACNTGSSLKPPRFSDKIFTIADALPLSKDSAREFLSALFTPADSLEVDTGDFLILRGKTFSIGTDFTEDDVNDVHVNLASVAVPMKELSVRMDSAWKVDSQELRLRHEPKPKVIGMYTDKQQRKKQF